MPSRNSGSARYVVEIRDAAGASLLVTSVDWTDSQRDLAMSTVLKLVGFQPAAPAKRQGNKARGDPAPRRHGRRRSSHFHRSAQPLFHLLCDSTGSVKINSIRA
jgi:hypothetical protein